MAKRILSIVMSMALLLSCVSGIALFTAAEETELPTPYVWIEVNQETGEITSSQTIHDSGASAAEKISDTEGYGIKLTGDWQGFWIGTDGLFGKDTKQVSVLVEYYIDASQKLNDQIFRLAPASQYNADGVWTDKEIYIDYFGAGMPDDGKGNDVLMYNQTAVMAYTYTEAQTKALTTEKAVSLVVKGCEGGTNCAYIKSLKLVDSKYVNSGDRGCDFYDFEPHATVSDYYPSLKTAGMSNMRTFPEGTLFQHFAVDGVSKASDPNVNKPVYIQFYTKAGYENTTITLQQYEVYTPTGRWACDNGYAQPTVAVENGVGSVLLPETSFTNANNDGSFRVPMEDFEKIASVEVYDVTTYCAFEGADEALKAMFHSTLKENGTNVEVVGKVDPTTDAEGYTGDIYCGTCGVLLAEGRVLPKAEESDLPDPYVVLETTNGNYTLIGANNAPYGGLGTLEVSPIGSTGEYGIPLKADWSGFRMTNMFASIPEGKDVVLAIEYFIDSDATGQMLRYRIGGEHAAHVDVFTTTADCHTARLILVPISAEQIAAAKGNDAYTIDIMGCDPGKNVTYIQSVRLIDPEYAHMMSDIGYDFMSFVEVPLCDYYPNITGKQSSGITLTVTREGQDDDGEVSYGYFALTQALLQPGEDHCPVAIRFTFKEGCDLTDFTWQYQDYATAQADGSHWKYEGAHIEDGVYEIYIEDATFTNLLNDLGSFRVPNRTVSPVLENLVEVRVIRVVDKTELEDLVSNAGETLAGTTYASQEAYKEALENAKVVLADLWVTEAMVADATAALEAAIANLVPCEHKGETALEGAKEETCLVPGYTGDTVCADCGTVMAEGEAIPAHKTELRNVKAPTCGEVGYTGDLYCTECDTIVRKGEEDTAQPLHTWDDGVVTKDATPSERGEITITCTECGATKIKFFDFEASLGDVNEDGKVDSTDARLVLQFAVQKIAPSALNLDVADVDGDNKIDSTDARIILQYAVGKIQALPAEQ